MHSAGRFCWVLVSNLSFQIRMIGHEEQICEAGILFCEAGILFCEAGILFCEGGILFCRAGVSKEPPQI